MVINFWYLQILIIFVLISNTLTSSGSSIEYGVAIDDEFEWNFTYSKNDDAFHGKIELQITEVDKTVKGKVYPEPIGGLNSTIQNKYVQLFHPDYLENTDYMELDISIVYMQLILLPDLLPVDFKVSFIFPVNEGYWDDLDRFLNDYESNDVTMQFSIDDNGESVKITGERDERLVDGYLFTFEYLVDKKTGVIIQYSRTIETSFMSEPFSATIELNLIDTNRIEYLNIPNIVLLIIPIILVSYNKSKLQKNY